MCRFPDPGFPVGNADVAQLVEHTLGKGEVTGSIPVVSSAGVGVREKLRDGCLTTDPKALQCGAAGVG